MQTSVLAIDQTRDGYLPADLVSEMCTQRWNRANFIVGVRVTGEGDYAGLSAGPYKDYLVELRSETGERRLQLRVDTSVGLRELCMDGTYRERQWWDSATMSVADLLNGILALRARNADRIRYRELTIRACTSHFQLSVITTGYCFLQRLRVSLRNWAHQPLNFGDHQILIVNPNSPDGTRDYLQALVQSYPHLRIREILTPEQRNPNKGAMMNRALVVARGEWTWLTDSDCVFAPSSFFGCAITSARSNAYTLLRTVSVPFCSHHQLTVGQQSGWTPMGSYRVAITGTSSGQETPVISEI